MAATCTKPSVTLDGKPFGDIAVTAETRMNISLALSKVLLLACAIIGMGGGKGRRKETTTTQQPAFSFFLFLLSSSFLFVSNCREPILMPQGVRGHAQEQGRASREVHGRVHAKHPVCPEDSGELEMKNWSPIVVCRVSLAAAFKCLLYHQMK